MVAHPNQGFLARAHRFVLVIGVLYALIVVLLAIPFFQLHALYLHSFKYPFFARFDQPERYGLAPGKTLNLQLTTPDNVTLGAWFVLSDAFYHAQSTQPSVEALPALAREAVRAHPTVLFLHGNAATRAVPFRVAIYRSLSARYGANVLALDYRGYAESTGVPSEAGLARDARSAWDWLAAQGAAPGDVLVMGHSLGTGVGTRFVHELAADNISPRGLVLLAPFSSIHTLLDTYYILGLLPLMKPLELIPGARTALKYFLAHRFDTLAIINNITAPLLIAHADDDWDIPTAHSTTLFDAILEPHLPPLPTLPSSGDADAEATRAYAAFQAVARERAERRRDLVETRTIDGFGTVEKFGSTVIVRSQWGGHDLVGLQEGVQDVIGDVFNMWR